MTVVPVLVACVSAKPTPPISVTTGTSFQLLLDTLASGWNENDAALAASVFTEDAIYVEPPDKQLYVGRDSIFAFFGGDNGRDYKMNMQWHNVAFNETEQVGSGEFTFSWPEGQVHGMVSIEVEGGKISLWREYFYSSDLGWEDFTRTSD